jgi:hypothetical protein
MRYSDISTHREGFMIAEANVRPTPRPKLARAGITGATAMAMVVRSLIDRDGAGKWARLGSKGHRSSNSV